MRGLVTAVRAGLAMAVAFPASAQTVVYDPTAVGKLIQQYENALQQLDQLKAQVSQGQQLLQHFNTASGVNAIASELATPALRAFLPDADRYVAAANGNFSALGSLGSSAASIRSTNHIYTPAAADSVGQDLEAQGNRAALDQALGQQVATVSATRLQGLQTLQTSIDGAKDVRAVMDLQARLQAEQALISNDQVRLQGLAMAQAAEDRIQQQRERERAAKAHADAEAAFRSGLQP